LENFVRAAGGDIVHDFEAFEGVFAIEEGSFVEIAEVFFDVFAREGSAAEDDGEVEAETVEFDEVIAHDEGGFDEEAGEADGIGTDFFDLVDDILDGLLDADVVDGEAVVGEDDVDEVFADVVNVSLDGGEDELAAGLAIDFFHVFFEVGDGGLHDFGGLEDEGELHLAGSEKFADGFHAGEKVVIDDREGGIFLAGFLEVFDEFLFITIDDVAGEFFFDGEGGGGFGIGGFGGLAEGGEEAERIVLGGLLVVDEIEGPLIMLGVDFILREDFGRVDDGGGEAGLLAFDEEGGVDDEAGVGLEAEGDVREAEGGVAVGEFGGDATDACDGFDGEGADFLLAGDDGEDEGIEIDVGLGG